MVICDKSFMQMVFSSVPSKRLVNVSFGDPKLIKESKAQYPKNNIRTLLYRIFSEVCCTRSIILSSIKGIKSINAKQKSIE